MENNYKPVSDYSVAPYNFIPLPERCVFPYKNYAELPSHDELRKDLLNGFMEYDVVNETPLIIGSSEKGNDNNKITFMKNAKGEYIIPGNSIRGMIRNNTAVLSMSSLIDYIADARFYYRSFGEGKNRREYRNKLDIRTKPIDGINVSAPFNIKSGFIYKDSNEKYFLVPSKKVSKNGLTYFIITEPYLRRMNPDIDENYYMYTKDILDLINNKQKYKSEGYSKNENKVKLLKQSQNIKYKPYCTEISFEIKEPRTVSKIGKLGQYKNKGYLMSSKFIEGKLAHYVLPEPDFKQEPIELSQQNGKFKFIDFYNNDLVRTKKKIFPNKDDGRDDPYFALPDKEGKENGKPIFYGVYNDKIYFGFSPYLRIPYDYSIYDLMPEDYKDPGKFSYVDSLFGFTNKGKYNYKSRLSFEDAICTSKEPEEDREYRLVTGEPHASSYALYLKQDMNMDTKEIKNYNDEDAKIRGIKQYLIKNNVTEDKEGKDRVSVYIKPLKTGTNFKGRIYFHNLKREELGLIAWALKIKDDAYEMLGYGKPYGFGKIRIGNINIKVEDLYKKYSSLVSNYYISEDREKLINDYKDSFKKGFNINLDQQESVKDLYILKSLKIDKTHENDARYMKLKEFSKILPLPDPKNLVKILSNNYRLTKNITNNLENMRNQNNKNFNNKKPGIKLEDANKPVNNKDFKSDVKNIEKNKNSNKIDQNDNGKLADLEDIKKLADYYNKPHHNNNKRKHK